MGEKIGDQEGLTKHGVCTFRRSAVFEVSAVFFINWSPVFQSEQISNIFV